MKTIFDLFDEYEAEKEDAWKVKQAQEQAQEQCLSELEDILKPCEYACQRPSTCEGATCDGECICDVCHFRLGDCRLLIQCSDCGEMDCEGGCICVECGETGCEEDCVCVGCGETDCDGDCD